MLRPGDAAALVPRLAALLRRGTGLATRVACASFVSALCSAASAEAAAAAAAPSSANNKGEGEGKADKGPGQGDGEEAPTPTLTLTLAAALRPHCGKLLRALASQWTERSPATRKTFAQAAATVAACARGKDVARYAST